MACPPDKALPMYSSHTRPCALAHFPLNYLHHSKPIAAVLIPSRGAPPHSGEMTLARQSKDRSLRFPIDLRIGSPSDVLSHLLICFPSTPFSFLRYEDPVPQRAARGRLSLRAP
jgi:hypothetical protein